VPTWILNFTKGGAKIKTQMPQQARELLEIGLWGIPPTAQAKNKLATGDRVLAYVGAPDRVFIGDAFISAPWHEWTADEAARYPLTATFTAGISLRDAHLWEKPVPLSSVWPEALGARTNPNALWYGAAVSVAAADFEFIALAGGSAKAGEPLRTRAQSATPSSISMSPTSPGSPAPVRAAPAANTTEHGLPESDGLFNVAGQLRKFLAHPKPLNEASTRAFFLDKCFDALGYTGFEDIDHGSVVQTGDFPDYVLHAGGKPAIAVEAKRIDHILGPKEAGQVVKYCSVLGLRWGLLTNGRVLQVYDAPLTGVPPEDRLVLEIDLTDWADREDFDLRRWPEASMLTKAAMETGEALERYAARELVRTLLSDASSSSIAALRTELQGKKVLLSAQAVVSLLEELFT
jgi:hypothetical protein